MRNVLQFNVLQWTPTWRPAVLRTFRGSRYTTFCYRVSLLLLWSGCFLVKQGAYSSHTVEQRSGALTDCSMERIFERNLLNSVQTKYGNTIVVRVGNIGTIFVAKQIQRYGPYEAHIHLYSFCARPSRGWDYYDCVCSIRRQRGGRINEKN